MNTETLVEANIKQSQASAAATSKTKSSANKDSERAQCGKGVCEVAWKPLPAKPVSKESETKQ